METDGEEWFMNECEYTCQLGAYHDGEMSASSAAKVERHLQDCSACAAELARLRNLSRLLASAARHELPLETLERLHRAVGLVSYAGTRRTAGILVAAAAIILVVCSAWLATFPATAEPSEPIPLWQVTAVFQQDSELAAASAEQRLAIWIVQDLSGKNAHD